MSIFAIAVSGTWQLVALFLLAIQPALSRADEYVDFVQGGIARRPANIDREPIAQDEPDTAVSWSSMG